MKMTLLKFGNPRIRLLTSKLTLCFFVMMMIVGFKNSYAGTITSTATGGTWGTGGTWIGGVMPSATDSVVIAPGAVVTTTANRTCAGINVMGTLTISVDNTTLTVNGGFGGTGTFNASRAIRQLTVTGNWTFTGTSPGSPTVTFNGTGNQSFKGVLASNGSTLVINKPSGIFTMNNAITVKNFTLTAGIFDPQTFLLTASGARTFTAGTLRVGAPTWAGNYSGGYTQPAAGIIEYYALGNQTVNNIAYPGSLVLSGSGVKTLGNNIKTITGNLTLSGTATATTVANIAIGGNLIVGTGSTFAIGTNFTLGVTGTTSVSGTLTLAGTGAKTFTGTITVYAGGLWNETAVAAISIANGINNSGTFTANASSVHTFQTNTQAISGTLTIPMVTVTGITLTNNGSLTVLTTLTGTGGLTMGSNSMLVLSGTTTITTLTANTNGSTVTYNGGVSQIIKAASYQDLVVNNTAGATLGGAVIVEGNLTLTNGKVDVLTYNLTVIGSINGASSTQYIKTSSTGRLVQVVTATPVVFPVGNSTYDPYIIINTGSSDSYGVRVLDVVSAPASNNSAMMIQRYWNVNEAVAGGSNLSMTAQWNTGETGGSYTGTGVKFGYHNGTTWTNVSSSQSGSNPFTASGTYDISGTDITGGVTFAVGQGAAFLAGPTVAVSALTTFGNQCTSTISPEKTYTVSGAQLTANIVITPPVGYEISTTSGSGFVSNPATLTFTQSGGYVNATTIYVRLKATAVTTYNGNITHVSTGSNSPNLAVTGAGVYDPPTVTTPTSVDVASTTVTLGGNLTALGCATVTEEGVWYSKTNGFIPGDVGSVKVSNTGSFATGTFTVNVIGLATSTNYFYKAFATSSIGTTYTTQATFTTSARSIYSIGSGNMNSITIWSLSSGGASCGCAPSGNDAVFIEGNNTITITANTPNFTSLNIGAGSTVTFTAGGNFTLSAKTLNIDGVLNRNTIGNFNVTNFNVDDGGKYVHAVDHIQLPAANWNANSTLEITGVVTNPIVGLNQTFANVTWNCPGQTIANMPFPDKVTMAMTGNLTILSTGSGGLLFSQPSLSVIDYTQSGGLFTLNSVNSSTKTLNVSGNYTHTGGTLQQSGGNGSTIGAIVFNGDSIQTFTSGGTLGGQINYTVNPGAIVDFGNSIISSSTIGSFTQLGTAILITKHPQGFSNIAGTGTIQCTGTKLFSSTGGFAYNGTVAQVTGNAIGGSGLALLTINNAAGVTLSNAILINSGGTVNIGTLTANSILNDGGYAISTSDASLNMTSGTLHLGTSGIATTMPTFSLFNLDSGTTIEYASGQPQWVDVNPPYQNLTFSGAGQKTVDSTTTNTLNAAGNLTTSGGLAYLGSSAVTIAGNIAGTGNITLTSGTINTQGNWTNTGTLTAGTSVITFDGAGSQIINSVTTTFNDLSLINSGNKTMGAAIKVNGDLNIEDNDTYSTNDFDVTLNGNFTNAGIMNGGSSAITIGLTAVQSIDELITTGPVTVTKTSGAATLVGDMKAGSLSINGSGGTLNLGSVLVTISGNITIASGATLNCNTSTVHVSGTSCSNNGTFNTNTGTFNYYNNTGGQILIPATYYNLTCNNNSGTDSVAGDIIVNNILSVALGGTLDMRSFVLSGTYTPNGFGTIKTANTSANPISSGVTWKGIVEYYGTGAQTIVANSYNNLTISGTRGSNNITLANDTIGVAGIFNPSAVFAGGSIVTANNTLNFNGTGAQTIPTFSYNNIVLSGARTGSPVITLAPGTINIAGNFTFGATGVGSYVTTGNTVNYNGANQPVANITYGNLIISGTGLKTLSGNTTVNNDLTVGGTSGLNAAGYVLDVKGNWTNNATFTPSTGTVIFSGVSAQTLSGPIAPAFNNLTINNASGVNMSNGVSVDGICSLTNGALNIGANTLTLNGTVTGAGSFVGGNTSILAINGKGDLGTIRFTNNTNLQSLTINRTISGMVTLGSNLAIVSGGSFTLSEGVLDLGTNSISVAVPITRINGMMNGTQGTLVMNSKTAQTIPDLLFTSNTLANLTVDNTGGVDLGGPLLLTGIFTPTSGTLTTRDNLTLVSDANNTARIANGRCSTCSYITGNIKVQQYVPAVARRWRFMGSPITNGTLADWKSETFITGVGGTQNGFDATVSNQASVYVYNESLITGDLNTGWEQATNINNALVVGKGYRVFIRGDRSDPGRLTGTNTTQNAVTMDLVGPVNQGDITMPVSFTSSGVLANDGWCLLSNPYPSAYDWNAHYDNGGFNTNLDPTIWVLNAQTGGYSSYNAVSNAGSLTNGIIAPGASFWVKANAASPTLIFKEQFKVASTSLQVFKTNEEESFSIKLEKDDITSDMLIVKYMDASTVNYDALYDIRKMSGTVNINAYGSDNVQLSLTVRPTVLKADTIKLSVSGSTGDYRLIFANSQELALQDNALLIDAYLNTVTDLKVAGEYPFSITSNAATQGLNRFYIVTGSNSALPVKLLLFGARKADKETVALNWSTAQEENNSHFEVERSTDGYHFQTIGTVNGNGTTSRLINYNFMDGSPEATNYYRLKQVDHNGAFMYSEIRLVQMNEVGSGLKLYPVPANTELTFSYKEEVKRVRIYDITGKLKLEQAANQQEMTIHLDSIEAGVYIIELTTLNGEVVKEKFVKD